MNTNSAKSPKSDIWRLYSLREIKYTAFIVKKTKDPRLRRMMAALVALYKEESNKNDNLINRLKRLILLT